MPQWWAFGALGCPGGQKVVYFEHSHVAYQIDRNDEQNRMPVKLFPYGQTGDLRVRSIGQIPLNFSYNVKDIYTKLCVCSHT